MKFTGTNKAIIKEANKLSKINFKKSSSGSSIYKFPVLLELKMRENFFGIKMRAFTEAKSYQNS